MKELDQESEIRNTGVMVPGEETLRNFYGQKKKKLCKTNSNKCKLPCTASESVIASFIMVIYSSYPQT